MSPRVGRPRDALGKVIDSDTLYVAITGFAGATPGSVVGMGKRLPGGDELVRRYPHLFLPDELDNPVLDVHPAHLNDWLAERRKG